MGKTVNISASDETMAEKEQALEYCEQGDARCEAPLERLAESGDVDAMKALAFDWYYDENKGYDPAKAFFWVQKAAGAGDLEAVVGLGVFYESAFGTAEEPQKAVACYERAAEQGVLYAIKRLVDCCLEAYGMEIDEKAAFDYAYRAADMKDSEGMRKLAQCYEVGWGVESDQEQALLWYERAADAGDVFSMRFMGRYFQGIEEYETAMEWFENAAALGDGEALNNIGLMYFKGFFGEEDPWTAVRYFEKSSDADCGIGAANLARCYEHGWGVAESWKRAVKYYERARDLGDEDARRYLKKQEHFVEALAELLSSIMHGKLLSGQKLWEDYTAGVTEKILYKPWGQRDIDAFLEKEGKGCLDALREEDGTINQTIIGALVMKPCKEKYEGALATADLVAGSFKVFGFLNGGLGKVASEIADGALAAGVKCVRTAHNALKSSLHIILTDKGICYEGNYVPYTLIEDIAVIENEEVRVQEEGDKELANGQLIQLQVTGEEELWERFPCMSTLVLPALP